MCMCGYCMGPFPQKYVKFVILTCGCLFNLLLCKIFAKYSTHSGFRRLCVCVSLSVCLCVLWM